MKRGKEGEKVMEPMFPRLHVKDTEKGGPRAPPRNKMALYEQLSIPSHRLSHVLSNSSNTTPSVVHPVNQGSENDRSMSSSGQVPLRHPSEQQYSQYCNTATSAAQVQKIKRLEEDNYRVPVFDNSMYNEEFDKYSNGMFQEKLLPSNPHHFTHTRKGNETGILESSLRLESTNQKNSSKETIGSVESISCSSSIGKSEGLKEQAVSSSTHEPVDKPRNSIDRLMADNSLQVEHCNDLQPSSVRYITPEENAATVTRSDSSNSQKSSPSEDDEIVHGVSCDTRSNDMERSDSLSETSILDTKSAVDVSPDDVVSMMGQKQFWKARTAIANQQRVFAIQVFELHRLIKVQKLIATLPHLVLEEALPGKENDGPEKPNHDNRALPASCQLASRSSEEPSYMNADHSPRMLCYNPAQGQQWLVPVMSPSEGLIYKPYPGPGFPGQAYGGCSPSMMGNFMTTAPHLPYRLPAFPPVAHGYFPPYSMPMMNASAFSCLSVEQRADNAKRIAVQDMLPPFPISPAVDASKSLHRVEAGAPDCPGGVIRVVPHHAVSASESAARIFRFIQEGRKRHRAE